MQGRMALLTIGILVWGYGVRADLERLRLVGIALLAASLLLRFLDRRAKPADQDDNP